MDEKLLTTGEAAKYLHISAATLRRWQAKGLIDASHQTVGGHARFGETSLNELKQKLKEGRIEEPQSLSAENWAADMLEQIKDIDLAPDKTDLAQQVNNERYLDALLPACEDWLTARKVGLKLVEDALASGDMALNINFFRNMAQAVLPVLLYAAAVMEEPTRRIEKWLDQMGKMRDDGPAVPFEVEADANLAVVSEIDAILRWKNNYAAIDTWTAFTTKDSKLRKDISIIIETVLMRLTLLSNQR